MLRSKALYWKSERSCEIKLPEILISSTILRSKEAEGAGGEHIIDNNTVRNVH